MWQIYLIIYVPLALFGAFVIWRLYAQFKDKGAKREVAQETEQVSISWWKGVVYAVLLLAAIISFAVFLSVKDEFQLPSVLEWIIWVVFAVIGLFLFKNRKLRVGR